ncbi:hypothetical protein WL76_01245 [Burkholderia ubonensis]|nr:hypothetical protein WL76_01245 [Burkholderia ubonensis]
MPGRRSARRPNAPAAPVNASATPHTAGQPAHAHALPASAAPSAPPTALARSAHRDGLRVVRTAGLETRINIWFVHGALPGRLLRPVTLLRDALAEVLAQENEVGSG